MSKPDHLYRFPCMYPWIGPKYECSERRLAIVAESHYLPQNVTCFELLPIDMVRSVAGRCSEQDRPIMDEH